MEKTLAIIKPDAVKKRVIGQIIQRIEEEGFTITGLKMLRLSKEEAEGFRAEAQALIADADTEHADPIE